jgi:hypothetical protein
MTYVACDLASVADDVTIWPDEQGRGAKEQEKGQGQNHNQVQVHGKGVGTWIGTDKGTRRKRYLKAMRALVALTNGAELYGYDAGWRHVLRTVTMTAIMIPQRERYE